MVFIPDDIFHESIKEAVKGDTLQQEVLMHYAMLSQNEGKEPDAARLSRELNEPLERVEDVLSRLSNKGWLERVRDYSE